MEKSYTGLANLGATCYINTTISCLANCHIFLNFILTKVSPNDQNLISELYMILNSQINEKKSVVPRRFVECLNKNIKELEIYTQNDINEFLAILIDKLNRCICQEITVKRSDLFKINRYQNTPYDNQRLKMDLNWFSIHEKEYSELLDIFYGQNISQIVCGNCDHIHHNYEIYFNIMAPIVSTDMVLDDCLNHHFKEEILNQEDHLWKCDKCNSFSKSKKTIKLWKNPSILIISLKRFTYDFKKINQNIQIPNELDIKKYSLSKKNNKYKLKSVAMHMGNMNNGHYYSICKHANEKWYIIDDLDVKEIQNPNFSQGYVFFYELDKS
jgi:ubiquitin carboxyl-terminal hydrolase 8